MTRRAKEPIAQLRSFADEYRHIQQEHARQSPRSATRHRLAKAMHSVEERFERLLTEWVPDDGLREQWRAFMHGRGDPPEVRPVPSPPLFRGRTEAGSVIEIQRVADGYDLLFDGARIEHSQSPWRVDTDRRGLLQLEGYTCEEVFDAPEPAIQALADFLANRAGPPWPWARELVADGLIDSRFALTARGRRRLNAPREAPPARPRMQDLCVVVADDARARVLVLDIRPDRGATLTQLVQVAEISNPMLRTRDGGTQREHGRREAQRHFAARVAEEAAAVWRRFPSCELVVAASPTMLGMLRPAIERQIRPRDLVALHELARDLTKLSVPGVHEALTSAGLLDTGRRARELRTS
ncbi:MAG: host attachment protein [Deltaproteobacteria bacterium]|nr:host attachment protein [Deltaproteobacteria bacterium]